MQAESQTINLLNNENYLKLNPFTKVDFFHELQFKAAVLAAILTVKFSQNTITKLSLEWHFFWNYWAGMISKTIPKQSAN